MSKQRERMGYTHNTQRLMRKQGDHTFRIFMFLLEHPELVDNRPPYVVNIETRYCMETGVRMGGAAEKLNDDVWEALAIIKALDKRYERKQDGEAGHV